MRLIDLLKLVATPTIIIIIINFSYKLGILTQRKSSDFLEKYDDKDKLVQIAEEEMWQIKKNSFKIFIHNLPAITFILFFYSIIKLTFDNGNFKLINEKTIWMYLFAPLLCIITIIEVLYFYNHNRQQIDDEGNIFYDRSQIILFMLLICSYVFCNIGVVKDNIINEKILIAFQINNITEVNVGVIFFIGIIVLKSYIIIPITRFLVRLDKDIFFINIKNQIKNSKTFTRCKSDSNFIGMIMSITTIMFIVVIVTIIIKKQITNIPLGDVILIICAIENYSSLIGQRAEYIRTYKSTEIKNSIIYYKNINNERTKWFSLKNY